MKIGVSMFLQAETAIDAGRALEHVFAVGRKAEQGGLSGVWVTDSLGRGKPSLDPLIAVAALCGVTERIELGTCILQVTLRPGVELAHRVQSLNLLSRGRLRLGVGVGSTRADFEVAGAAFEHRFERFTGTLEAMRTAWRGEPAHPDATARLSPWPGLERGPPLFIGAWRKPAWITYAAQECDGWIASGMRSHWRDVEEGMRVFRAAEGKRAILANVPFDLSAGERSEMGAETESLSLICPGVTARQRIRRLEQLGFDDILLGCPLGSISHLDKILDLAQSL